MEIEAIRNVSHVQEPVTVDMPSYSKGKGTTQVVEQSQTTKVVSGGESVSLGTNSEQELSAIFETKEPAMSSIESAVTSANHKMTSTRCEYAYDEVTKRVSIKVYDKKSDELIREVPPEESLEMLQKMWELAGLIVDEKR